MRTGYHVANTSSTKTFLKSTFCIRKIRYIGFYNIDKYHSQKMTIFMFKNNKVKQRISMNVVVAVTGEIVLTDVVKDSVSSKILCWSFSSTLKSSIKRKILIENTCRFYFGNLRQFLKFLTFVRRKTVSQMVAGRRSFTFDDAAGVLGVRSPDCFFYGEIGEHEPQITVFWKYSYHSM